MNITTKEEDTLIFGESPSYFNFFDLSRPNSDSQSDDSEI